jgi:hypothetical protein
MLSAGPQFQSIFSDFSHHFDNFFYTFEFTNLLKFNLFVVVAGLNSPFVPLLQGHVPDDVTAMASTKDEEAGHDQVSDVEQGPGLHPETL